MKKSIEYEIECPSCDGIGLYSGMAEKEGAAIVCHSCKGEGHYTHKHVWNEWAAKKEKEGTVRVYQTNPGIWIGEGNGHKFEDFGGMPYKDWKEGKPFPPKSEMRNFTCPAWWYQCVDYKRKPDWDECVKLGSFSECKSFKNKKKCWERFDSESK